MTDKKTLPLSHPAKLIGTWFGSGLAPKAPGTMGTLAALPFAYVIQSCFGNTGLFVASILAFVAGVVATNVYLKHTDSQDPKEIVIDEVAAIWLLLSFMYPTAISYVVGFALFRLFDVLKLWPISLADRKIKGGFGVMFDDILAALYPLVLVAVVATLAQTAGFEVSIAQLQRMLGGDLVP